MDLRYGGCIGLINGMYCFGERKQHPLHTQLCQLRAMQKRNEFAVVFEEAEFVCVCYVYQKTQTSTDRDEETVTRNLGGSVSLQIGWKI